MEHADDARCTNGNAFTITVAAMRSGELGRLGRKCCIIIKQGLAMKKTKSLLQGLSLAATLFAGAVCAGNHPIILIHGFQPSQLPAKPNADAVTRNGDSYWQGFWRDKASARIDWPSHERLKGKISTDYVWPKLQQISRSNLCAPGCVLVTHSTGDLVARHLLENQATWLRNAGLNPLNIVATIDFAGAGGGAELADLAINVADGHAGELIRQAVGLWLGEAPRRGNLGVLNDLQVNTARQTATLHNQRIPRLRIVGGASDLLGATSPFIPGDDDGVVALHSSCGANRVASFNSCSTSVALDGKLTSVSSGVSGLWPQHFPLIMAHKYSHGTVIENSQKGRFTTLNGSATYSDNSRWNLAYSDIYYGFPYFARWRYVNNSDRQSLSQLVWATAP
jgi:hypothetical protein